MTTTEERPETFAEFKDSFSYGSRTDLLFKFLKGLPEKDSADLLQDLLQLIGETTDDGDPSRLFQRVYEAQHLSYSGPGFKASWEYDDAPFTPLKKPVSEARIGLLTSTGHFAAGDDPEPFGVEDMTQAEATDRVSEFGKAAPELSAIPVDTSLEKTRVRHAGYDIRAAVEDRNICMPIDRLLEFEDSGVIGELASPAYSFVGLTSQIRLLKEVLPGWVATIREQRWDAALLVPI